MRIGIFTNNYLPRTSGVARAVENFRKGLEKLGQQVYIFAPEYQKTRKEKEKNVFRFPSLRLPPKTGPFHYPIALPYSSKIKKIVQNLNLDIIHSQHPYLLGKVAKSYAQELGIPLVFTNHTLYHKYFTPLPLGLKEFLESFVLRQVIKYAKDCDLVIVPTKGVGEILKENGLKTPIKKIPTGIELKKFTQPKKDQKILLRNYGLSEKDILLLSVTRLSYEKNLDFLIKAFSFIVQKNNNVYLMIVGEGLERKKLESLTKLLGLKNRIIFTGQIDYKELPTFYWAADIFVFTSLIDVQALVLLEAMASSLPIVAIEEAAGSRELIKDGKTGFLTKNSQADFVKAVLKLVENKNLRKKMGKESQKESQKYSLENTAQELLKAYRLILRK